MEITMFNYLFIGLLIFLIGFIGSVTVKNIIKILISIEFMLLGVNINFITFATYCDNINFSGYIIALFYTVIGAVELVIGLYIFYLMYQKKKSANIEKYSDI